MTSDQFGSFMAVDFIIKFFLNAFGTLQGAYWSIYFWLKYFSPDKDPTKTS